MNLIVAVIILLFCIIAGARHLSSYRANSPANHARRKFELLSRVMRCLGKLSMLDGTFSEEEKISLQIISDKFYPDTKIDQCELEKFFNSGKDFVGMDYHKRSVYRQGIGTCPHIQRRGCKG